MRISIFAIGSRGDVQPLVALALGLRAVGHDVSITTHCAYTRMASDHGIRVSPLSIDPDEILSAADMDYLRAGNRSNVGTYYRFMRQIVPPYETIARECWAASEEADVILHSILGSLIADTIAEGRDIPDVMAYWGPFYPTGSLPVPGLPPAPTWLRGATPLYNRASHAIAAQLPWQIFRPATNRFRDEIGLRPLGVRGPFAGIRRRPGLFGYSDSLVPRPAEWPSRIHVTGFWFLPAPADWSPPRELAQFIESGDPPIAVTLGSTGSYRTEETIRTIVDALHNSGRRTIVCGSPLDSGLLVERTDLFAAPYVPYDWLFDRVEAVIHHAGVGTVAAALRAGLPSASIPLSLDQHFWADRLYASGASPRPAVASDLTTDAVMTIVREITTNTDMRRRAENIGEMIHAEDGVSNAVRAFEREMMRIG